MKTFILFLFGMVSTVILAQNTLTKVEYFIGDDPGLGNATALLVSSQPSLSASFAIPVGMLSDGLHTLHLRTKSGDDKWSLYARKAFFLYGGLQSQTIEAAEFFIGSDPGLGNGTPIPVDAGASVEESFTIPLDDLEEGLHVLKIRVKDGDSKWSLFAKHTFFVSGTDTPKTIVAAEYFIGADPGLGNAVALEITAGNSLDGLFDVQLADLEPYKLHQLHIRVKDNVEKWSLYARKSFFTIPNPVDLNITAAEYFIDEDPGTGEGNSIDVALSNSIDEIALIELPASLPDGFHFLHIRVKNENQKWSTYARHEFESGEGLSTLETSQSLKIFPNPTRDMLNIALENLVLERVRLIDAQGQVLLDEPNPTNQIDLSPFADGVYILHIFTSEGAFSRKIVKN